MEVEQCDCKQPMGQKMKKILNAWRKTKTEIQQFKINGTQQKQF